MPRHTAFTKVQQTERYGARVVLAGDVVDDAAATARELAAREGDELALDYHLWDANAGLSTKTEKFRVAGVLLAACLAVQAQPARDAVAVEPRGQLLTGCR